jgi:hypothetical protein
MSSAFRLSFPILALALGVTLTAQQSAPAPDPAIIKKDRPGIPGSGAVPEMPSKEFQELMKSNSSIITVDGPGGITGGKITNALVDGREDYETIVKEAEILKKNFAAIEAFFATRKYGDALAYAQTGAMAAADIRRFAADAEWQYGDRAAMARSKVEILRAQVTLSSTCRDCHIAHRVQVLSIPLTFGIM